MITGIRERLDDLVETLGQLDALLDAGGELPPIAICRLGVQVDEAAARFGQMLELLQGAGTQRQRPAAKK